MMPYRRLPNTDAARLRVLKVALRKGKSTAPPILAFDYSYIHKLEVLVPKLDTALKNLDIKLKEQTTVSQKYKVSRRKARLYVSHFIQVLNMCILREEFKPSVRKLYGLEEFENKVPDISKDEDLFFWAEKIKKGEASRTASGALPIFNPRMAIVSVHVDKFKIIAEKYNNRRKMYKNAQLEVQKLRPQIDQLILALWNEIEKNVQNKDDSKRIEQLKAYGVVFLSGKKRKRRLIPSKFTKFMHDLYISL